MSEARKLEQQGDDLFTVLSEIQARYTAAIHVAASKGDSAEVGRLAGEMAEKIKEVQLAPRHLSLVAPPAPVRFYPTNLCSVDLDEIVYDGDRDFLKELLEDQHFVDAAGRIMAQLRPYNARKNLLKTGMKLTRKLAPEVHKVLDLCKERLGLKSEVEIYVEADVNLNAFCCPPDASGLLIGVTSALLERFDEAELAFVIGHEIGHALFNHSRFPVRALLENDNGGEFSPLHAMRLFSWKRNAEISADRIGLICNRDFNAAARAFFKLSSGVTAGTLKFHVDEFVNQLTELSQQEGGGMDPQDWYSTHPLSPMRVKALDMFNRSENYFKLQQKLDAAEISEVQLEVEIKKFMATMEPSYLQERTEVSRYMRDFLFTSGFLVAAANGQIDDSELDALAKVLTPEEVAQRVNELTETGIDELWKAQGELAGRLNIMIPVIAKLNLIKDMTIIASADGSIDEQEMQVMYKIACSLQIRPEFVDHVIGQLEETT